MSAVDNVEQSILGMRLLASDAVDYVIRDRVKDYMFADPRHAALWRLCETLQQEGGRPDAVTLAANRERIPALERANITDDYILELIHWAPAAADVVADTYTQALEDAYSLRMMRAAHARTGQLLEANDTPMNILGDVQRLWADVDGQYLPVGVHGQELEDAFTSWLDGTDGFTPTPWTQMNEIIDGWRPGGLYIVGARPGGFKSAIALQAALGVAFAAPVVVSSLEMSRQEVMARMVSARARAPYREVIAGDLTPAQREHAGKIAHEVAQLPISIDDRAAVGIDDIRAHARAVKRRHGNLGMIVVDYLQLMSSPRGDKRPRHEIVADFSRQLKIMAGDLGCPVMALSQLNRTAEEGSGPSMAHLRESGALEQDANVIMLLSCPESAPGVPDKSRLTVAVVKNRQGPTGTCILSRVRDSMSFDD